MEFGFVPAQIVKDLEEIGNWKVCTHVCLDTVLFAYWACDVYLGLYEGESTRLSFGFSCCVDVYLMAMVVQARSAAVDKLLLALQRVSDKDDLLPTLSKLLRFLASLGEDANFKISLATLDILADLTSKVGPDLRPYLGYVTTYS